MAQRKYKDIKDELLQKAIKAIQENELITMEDVVSFLPCKKTTFYDIFPAESEEMNIIKDEIDKVKTNIKVHLRAVMRNSESPAHTAMLYRLCATPEELDKLSMTKNVNENTHTVNMPIIQWVEPTD